MIDKLWSIIIFILLTLAFLATIKLSLFGNDYKTKIPIINLLTSPYWAFILIIFIPMQLGRFGRGESSPLPWVEFSNELSKHGMFSSIFAFIMIFMVDLWLLWTPSHIYISNLPLNKKNNAVYVRLFNISIGFILTSQANFIYEFLSNS